MDGVTRASGPYPAVVLITGSSRGIGLAITSQVLSAGYAVAASMRGVQGRNADAARRLTELGAFVVDIDVTDDQSVRRGVAGVIERFGRVDVLVNNAGYAVFGALESATLDDLRTQFDVNVLGPQRMLRVVLPAMRERRSGLIIQISSGAGRYVLPGRGSYAMSKWALEALSDTYRIELVQFGIDVVTMELGPFDSDFQEARGATSDVSRSAEYPHVVRAIRHSDAMREAHPEHYLDPSAVGQAINRVIAAEPTRRPWRVVLHPLRDWLVPYNDTLEALQRRVLDDRGFTGFVPQKSDGLVLP